MSRLHPFARLLVAAMGLAVSISVAQVVVTLGFAIYSIVETPGQSPDKLIALLTKWATSNALGLTVASYPVGVLWLGFCRTQFDKRSFVSLGLRRPRALSNAVRGIAAGLLSIAVIWAISWLTGVIAVNGWSAAARQMGAMAAFPLLGWLLAFAAVGFFEELLFRGYALHNMTNWLGWKWAVALQATIFALIHLGNVAMAPREAQLSALGAMPSIFLIGVFFALSYRKTGSLWFPIGFHLAWNFSLGCLFSLPVSGIKTFQLLDVTSQNQSWLSGGAFGSEGSFYLLPVIGALIWLMLQAPDHPQAILDLELTKAPQTSQSAPPVVAPVSQNQAADAEIVEAEEERENRYSTKFGTSEGFDEGMLRELRELQGQRERAEVEAREERAAQTAVVEVELLKPPTVQEAVAVEAETGIVAEKPQVEAKPIETATEVVLPIEARATEEKAVEEMSVEEAGAPVVQVEEKPAPVPVPAKKKSLPKW